MRGDTLTMNLSAQEASDLGGHLIAAAHQAVRSTKERRTKKPRSTPSSSLLPLNTIQVTVHEISDLKAGKMQARKHATVLGRYFRRREESK